MLTAHFIYELHLLVNLELDVHVVLFLNTHECLKIIPLEGFTLSCVDSNAKCWKIIPSTTVSIAFIGMYPQRSNILLLLLYIFIIIQLLSYYFLHFTHMKNVLD